MSWEKCTQHVPRFNRAHSATGYATRSCLCHATYTWAFMHSRCAVTTSSWATPVLPPQAESREATPLDPAIYGKGPGKKKGGRGGKLRAVVQEVQASPARGVADTMPYAAESVVLTAAREAKKIWPALVGLGTVGFAVVQVTASATPEARAPKHAPCPLAHAACQRVLQLATLLRTRVRAAATVRVFARAAHPGSRVDLGFRVFVCEARADRPPPARRAGPEGVQVHQPEPGPLDGCHDAPARRRCRGARAHVGSAFLLRLRARARPHALACAPGARDCCCRLRSVRQRMAHCGCRSCVTLRAHGHQALQGSKMLPLSGGAPRVLAG
jgi:hypothetical protein